MDEIKPSPNLIELYQKAALPTLTFQTTKTPMVCPPVPWVSIRLGGYLLNETKIVRWVEASLRLSLVTLP